MEMGLMIGLILLWIVVLFNLLLTLANPMCKYFLQGKGSWSLLPPAELQVSEERRHEPGRF